MAKIRQLKIDDATAAQGLWFKYAADVRLRIAHISNPEFQSWRRERLQPLVEKHGSEDAIPFEEVRPITIEAVARFILVDWANLQEDSGEPMDCTVEKKLELFKMEGFGDDLLFFVLQKAQNVENYRGRYLDEAAKN